MNDEIINLAIQIYFDKHSEEKAFYFSSLHVDKLRSVFSVGDFYVSSQQVYWLLRTFKPVESLFESELIFFPIHFNGHWSLAVAVRPLSMVRVDPYFV